AVAGAGRICRPRLPVGANKEFLDVGQRRTAIPASARNCSRRRILELLRAGFRIDEVNQPVLSELWMQGDVEQAAERARRFTKDLRQSRKRSRIEDALADH